MRRAGCCGQGTEVRARDSPWPAAIDHPAIQVEVTVDHDAEREFLVDSLAGRHTQPPGRVPVVDELDQSSGPGVGTGSGHQAAGLMIGDQVGIAADSGDDAGKRGGHCLEERVAHPLGQAGQDEEIGGPEMLRGVRHSADELDPVGDAKLHGQCG